MEKNNKKNVEIANSILLPEIVKFMNEGHTVTLLLKGYSMRPFLEHGRDEGLLKKADSPKIGTPVLAEIAPGKYVLHRLIAVNGEKVTLLGDGNITPEYCRYSDIKGEAIGFYRKGRKQLDPIDGWKWKVYSKLWMSLRPIRRWLLAFYRRIWIPFFGTI